MSLKGAVLVCGTSSDVGKSRIVGGLCRVFVSHGIRVAPFKAQNMSLNSCVTVTGHEVARSVEYQAVAARTTTEVAMNPILLKPSGEKTSQLIVMGRPVGEFRADDFQAGTHRFSVERLRDVVHEALLELRSRFDVVIAEGAGGAAEINLLERDLVNLPLALRAQIPAVLVGDIERGGVFSSIYGTVALLPDELRAQIRGFVINKFRGERRLLDSGIVELERRCDIPCLGVVPHLGDLAIDAEDSLNLVGHTREVSRVGDGPPIDVAVIQFPRLSNFTDFEPLAVEYGVTLRYVASADALGDPDLIIVPGSKSTVDDLVWMRRRGIDLVVAAALGRATSLLGICAGYQMFGTVIEDEVESHAGRVPGLGILEVHTVFEEEKCTLRRSGTDRAGAAVDGFEIHHGRPAKSDGQLPWFFLDGPDGVSEEEGVADPDRGVFATSLHGIFESDDFRRSFLDGVAERRGRSFVSSPTSFEVRRQSEIDRVAEALSTYLDIDALREIIAEGRL
ncbi:MAG TPA: cobyric acid synthase [Acidimicrobiales bacterium]|nr:cobyric acid synthase [Acidimicrobiales bacterium]